MTEEAGRRADKRERRERSEERGRSSSERAPNDVVGDHRPETRLGVVAVVVAEVIVVVRAVVEW